MGAYVKLLEYDNMLVAPKFPSHVRALAPRLTDRK